MKSMYSLLSFHSLRFDYFHLQIINKHQLSLKSVGVEQSVVAESDTVTEHKSKNITINLLIEHSKVGLMESLVAACSLNSFSTGVMQLRVDFYSGGSGDRCQW